MKYAFVIPNIQFLFLQYRDFEFDENKELVRIDFKFRKFMKLINKYSFYKTRIFDDLFFKKLDNFFKKCDVNEEYCFILYSRTYEDFRSILSRYLRKKYYNCKIVVYYGDLISRHLCNIDNVVKDVDRVYSFDEEDAKKNKIGWILEPFASSLKNLDEFSEENNSLKWDVTFVGYAKNRYEKIIAMYELLKSKGMKCDFHIMGVPVGKRKYTDEIEYSPLGFDELLRHVVASKCILEIMQDDGISPTTRYAEAMVFERNLLTDCCFFKNESNRPVNIIYYSSNRNIDDNLLEEVSKIHELEYEPYINQFSIERMIDVINNDLYRRLKNDFVNHCG